MTTWLVGAADEPPFKTMVLQMEGQNYPFCVSEHKKLVPTTGVASQSMDMGDGDYEGNATFASPMSSRAQSPAPTAAHAKPSLTPFRADAEGAVFVRAGGKDRIEVLETKLLELAATQNLQLKTNTSPLPVRIPPCPQRVPAAPNCSKSRRAH